MLEASAEQSPSESQLALWQSSLSKQYEPFGRGLSHTESGQAPLAQS
jgi:hypothetical protein